MPRCIRCDKWYDESRPNDLCEVCSPNPEVRYPTPRENAMIDQISHFANEIAKRDETLKKFISLSRRVIGKNFDYCLGHCEEGRCEQCDLGDLTEAAEVEYLLADGD